jgi:tetratricopeptide (TPR) repeat protein
MAQYTEAKSLLEEALAIAEGTVPLVSAEMYGALSSLAVLCKEQGQYQESLPLQEKATSICRQLYDGNDVRLAHGLSFHAELLRKMRQIEEAEQLHRQALQIHISATHPDEIKLAQTQTHLGCCLMALKRPGDAEKLFEASLHIRQGGLGQHHAAVSESLNYLGESLLAGAIKRRDESIGKARGIRDRSPKEMFERDVSKAVPLIKQALNIRERVFGEEHPAVAHALGNLAACERELNKLDASVFNYRRCIWICEEKVRERGEGRGKMNMHGSMNSALFVPASAPPPVSAPFLPCLYVHLCPSSLRPSSPRPSPPFVSSRPKSRPLPRPPPPTHNQITFDS